CMDTSCRKRSPGLSAARHLRQQLLSLREQLVLDEHLVAGGDDLRDRGEVALATGRPVAEQRPDDPEHDAERDAAEHRAEPLALAGEDAEQQTDEQAEPRA